MQFEHWPELLYNKINSFTTKKHYDILYTVKVQPIINFAHYAYNDIIIFYSYAQSSPTDAVTMLTHLTAFSGPHDALAERKNIIIYYKHII